LKSASAAGIRNTLTEQDHVDANPHYPAQEANRGNYLKVQGRYKHLQPGQIRTIQVETNRI
jgi:hypothetical protein